MRLLIVEDEYYTRQGIMEEIDLPSLGFDQVQQADDGLNALKIAKNFPPDIVLADVRMPRMDGIEMSFRLRKCFPDCHIVFMSGYADKEYLKAAIELKAVSYIEKPFRSRELREVLARAAALCRQDQERDRREAALLLRAEAGVPLLRSEVALMLVQQPPDEARMRRVLEASGLFIAADSAIAVALARPSGRAFPDDPGFRERFLMTAETETARSTMGGLIAFKGLEEAVMVLYVPPERQRILGEASLGAVLARLMQAAPDVGMAAGVSPVSSGLSSASLSYKAARSALEAAFFLGPGAIAFDAQAGRADLSLEANAIDDLQACLDREDGTGALTLLRSAARGMRASGSRDTCGARDFFTRLLLRLAAFAERRGVDPFEGVESVRLLSQTIERAGTLDFVASLLESRIRLTFERLNQVADEGRVVTDVKRAVHRGFPIPGLSLQEVAREVGFSPAYVCRLFKEATGETIHRYITVYRLERAKDLLADPRQPKMTEVAARAGFADANYFARAFRRETGLSPSEYRENALR
ncbi:MAG: helix-turn-helix domain-containing protein [Spirochaetia bacterium]|jgi:two-component system response regulator YesN